MSLATRATVRIAAAPAQVFAWLVEPARLTTWLGGSGGMPEDTTQLHVGWTGAATMAAPGGGRPMGVEITAYDSPHAMATTVTYAGGRGVSSYTLVEKDGGTEVRVDGETDYANDVLVQTMARLETLVETPPG